MSHLVACAVRRRFRLLDQHNLQTYAALMQSPVRNMLATIVAATLVSVASMQAMLATRAHAESPAPLTRFVDDADANAAPVVRPTSAPVTLAAWALRAAREQAAAAVIVTTRVEVALFDENQKEAAKVWIGRDGSVDPATAKEIKRLFKCRRSGRERKIDQGALALLADVAAQFPGKTIEYVSVYRGNADESRTSPHRHGRAIDFRIRGVKPQEIRDYLWRTFRGVGIGWYPEESFIHMDHRPGEKDISWTFIKGENLYNPGWAAVARSQDRPELVRREPGV